jgi:HEPN domain-containing protein
MKSETKLWLEIAEGDYEMSMYGFKMARYPQALYLLCQAIEKTLKAGIVEFINQSSRKTHNLVSIAKHTKLSFSSDQLNALRELTRIYSQVRYPDYQRELYNTKAKVEPVINQGKSLYLWLIKHFNDH